MHLYSACGDDKGVPDFSARKLEYFEWFDGQGEQASGHGLNQYTIHGGVDVRRLENGPNIHAASAPWACVPAWIDFLMGGPDLEVRSEGSGFEAISLIKRFAITFDSSHRFVGVRALTAEGRPAWGTRFEYSTASGSAVEAPEFIHLLVWNSDGHTFKHDMKHEVVRVDLNPQNVEALLSWEDVRASWNRYDSATTNVYRPDGTLAFNEKEVVRAFDEAYFGTGRLRSWLCGFLITGLVASSGYGLHRWFKRA